MTQETREATIYRQGSAWCYALTVDGTTDHSDTIGCDDAASEAEASEALRASLPAGPLTITRAADVPAVGRGGY